METYFKPLEIISTTTNEDALKKACPKQIL
jgi:hypothetical protein